MSSCFGRRKSTPSDHDPLLPQYSDDTVLQRKLHQKLHSYQEIRALSKGFMPSTEQLVANLRTFLASDLLNPDEYSVSDSGRLLTRYARQFLKQFIDTLQHKNESDQLQDFLWLLSYSRVSVDTGDMGARARRAKSRAQLAGAYESVRTVLGFLLTNSDFRIFVADLQTIGRQVFKDFAGSVEKVAAEAERSVEASGEDVKARDQGNVHVNGDASAVPAIKTSDQAPPPSQADLANNANEVVSTIAQGVVEVSHTTRDSVVDHFTGEEKQVLIERLKKGVGKLRYQKDYTDSVSTMSLLIQRYALAYSRAVEETVDVTQNDIRANAEMHSAALNFWSLMKSFGSSQEWERLEQAWQKLLSHKERDSEFENAMAEVGDTAQKLLTDPNAWNDVEKRVQSLQDTTFNSKQGGSSVGDDVRALVDQIARTIQSVRNDQDINKLWETALRVVHVISPKHSVFNRELYQDAIGVFVPALIQGIQYIPIPRLELSVPEIDLLLENLILEPGRTVNNSSFLPFRLRVETQNDVELRKARTRVVSQLKSLVTIKLDGMTVRGDEVGFWLRAHSGILRLADEGILSFQMDERGMDIHLDVEVGAEKLEKILTLRAVRVRIHKLTYQLRKSKFSWLAWLVKPLLRPIVRKVMERQIATAIADAIHAANREIVFARERLRATRIADPQDVATFFKAVMTRLTPEADPDVEVRVGVAQPGKGVFKGVYAPGSVVKVWNEEALKAEEVVEEYDKGGWRNDIFDIVQ